MLGLIQTPFLSKFAFVKVNNNGNITYQPTNKVFAGKYDDGDNPFSFARGYGYDALANPMWIL